MERAARNFSFGGPLCRVLWGRHKRSIKSVSSLSNPDRIDVDPERRGRIFEAVIGAALTQSTGELYTWREKNNEVDYILLRDQKLYAIEVKSGRLTKRSGLDAFFNKFPNTHAITITPENCHTLLSDADAVAAPQDI